MSGQSIAADLAGRACSDCRVREGGQHLPHCHRQGKVTAASDYRDRALQVLPVLSEAICQVRFDLGITQAQFAERIGSTRAEVHQIETGSSCIRLFPLLKVGEMAAPGPAKTAIVEELRMRLRAYPLLQVVA